MQGSPSPDSPLPKLLAVAALMVLPACTIDHALEASDKNLFLIGRAQLPIDDVEGDDRRTSVEFSGAWFDGDSRVSTPAGAEMHYDVTEIGCAVRYGMRRGSLGLGVLAGLTTDTISTRTAASTGAARNDDHQFWVGPTLGVEADWDATPALRLYGRVTGGAMLPSSTTLSSEIGLGFKVVDKLEALLGYRHWNLRGDTDTLLPGFDAVDLSVDGVFLGGALRF
ncbi:MAG: hypothetical protein U1F36_02370 [Planctomycetota bacterium]